MNTLDRQPFRKVIAGIVIPLDEKDDTTPECEWQKWWKRNGFGIGICENPMHKAFLAAWQLARPRSGSVKPEASEHSPPEATKSLEGKDAQRETAREVQMALSIESRMELHTDFRFARDAVAGIVTSYQDYVRLLNDEIGDLIGLAYAHGWKSKRGELGKLCRERIDNALALWQTELDWHEGRALDSLEAPSAESKEPKSDSVSDFSKPDLEHSPSLVPQMEKSLEEPRDSR